MRKLTIGSDVCRSVFRLRGKDEDALTHALGYLFARDRKLLVEFLKDSGVLTRGRGKSYSTLLRGYAVKLQERRRTGRTDVIIEAPPGLRVVIEAKVGTAHPSTCQLLHYTVGCSVRGHSGRPEPETWREYEQRYIVSLTAVPPDERILEEVRSRLALEEEGDYRDIRATATTWEAVQSLVHWRASSEHPTSPGYWPLREFQLFMQEDYPMSYYDVEVLIQDVSGMNATLFDENHIYKHDVLKKASLPLYVGAYKTKATGDDGLTHIARRLQVVDTEMSPDLVARMRREIQDVDGFEFHWAYWRPGLEECIDEFKGVSSPPKLRLFFLDEPQELPKRVVKRTKLGTLARGFNKTIQELLRADDL